MQYESGSKIIETSSDEIEPENVHLNLLSNQKTLKKSSKSESYIEFIVKSKQQFQMTKKSHEANKDYLKHIGKIYKKPTTAQYSLNFNQEPIKKSDSPNTETILNSIENPNTSEEAHIRSAVLPRDIALMYKEVILRRCQIDKILT